jgi:hypothetical protein
MKALEGGISGSFSTFPTGFNMTSSDYFRNKFLKDKLYFSTEEVR